METLLSLFERFIVFVYHCFDRIVINGYLSMLSRSENVVYFFNSVVGESCLTKEVLSARTNVYNKWVESFSRNHHIPLEWAEKGVRKEAYIRPWLKRMERENRFGVFFIFKSMEQGSTFRSMQPKYKTDDPNYRIIKKNRSRFTHYYFYIRDEKLGLMTIRVASFLPFQTTCYLNGHNFIERELNRQGIVYKKNDNAFVSTNAPEAIQEAADRLTPELISERLDYWTLIIGPKFSGRERKKMNLSRFYAMTQIEYCTNFVFRRNFPIQRLFLRCCELSFFSFTADKISNVFGQRITRRFKGKLQTVLERIDQSHHVFRAYFKNSFVKQYEKLRTFLRMEICSNNTPDLKIKKSISNLLQFRGACLDILDRFANHQSYALNVHFDFSVFKKMAQPIMVGRTKIAGIKIQDIRMSRLMESFMHAGNCLDGWTSSYIHRRIVSSYGLSNYSINQLRYDLRKMKAHGLIERNGKHYSYRLTENGRKTVVIFVLFHKRLFGPLANSLFHFRPNEKHFANSKLEKAYHKADHSINRLVELLAA